MAPFVICNLCFFCFDFIARLSSHYVVNQEGIIISGWHSFAFNTFVSLIMHKLKLTYFSIVNDPLHWFRAVFFPLSNFSVDYFSLHLYTKLYEKKLDIQCDIVESLFVPSWTNFIAWRTTKPKSISISNNFTWNSACHGPFFTQFFIHLVATKGVENRVRKQQYENSIEALTQRK